jgi:hypothetical protein
MLEELPDFLGAVLLVDVAPGEEEILRKGNQASVCISYDSTNTGARYPARREPGFRSLDDFQFITKRRADLVFFGSDTSPLVMGSVISRFLQSDGFIVIEAGSALVSRSQLASKLSWLGCGGSRVLTLHRLPGAFAIGYEVGADVVTRVCGKLVGEFFGALGRVVVGAEVLVNGAFKKPDGLVGPYFIVAVAGSEFGRSAAYRWPSMGEGFALPDAS